MVAEAPLFEHNEKEHWYKLDGRRLESVTEVIVSNRLIDTTFMTERGRERGHLVAKAVALDLQYPGELDEDYEVGIDLNGNAPPLFAPGELMGFVRGARKFVADFQFKPTMIEHALYHGTDLYAGRLDAAGPGHLPGSLKDALLLVDWTLSTDLEIKRIQTAAYASALPKAHTYTRVGVKLKIGDYKHRVYPVADLIKDRDDFRAGQRMHRLRQEIYGDKRTQTKS